MGQRQQMNDYVMSTELFFSDFLNLTNININMIKFLVKIWKLLFRSSSQLNTTTLFFYVSFD